MVIDRTVKFTVRLNMLNPAHVTINKVLNELNLDILKSKNQFFIIHANGIDISIYSEEFGKTAKEWRDSNPNEKGNIRDSATIYQLLVLANMESYNAILIKQGKTQADRMHLLHELAVQQMTTLSSLELSNLPGIEKK